MFGLWEIQLTDFDGVEREREREKEKKASFIPQLFNLFLYRSSLL